MTTITLPENVQRARLAHHARAALTRWLPAALRPALASPPRQQARSAVEKAAVEAHEVREMAQSYESTDPGFAADLYAAAARHESLHEG